MTKLLDETIRRVRTLPEDEQDAAAGALMEYIDGLRDLQLSDEQVAELRRRRAAPDSSPMSMSEARRRVLRPPA